MLASWLPKGLNFSASTSPTADLQDLGKFIFGDHTISVGIEDPEGSPHDFTPGKTKFLRKLGTRWEVAKVSQSMVSWFAWVRHVPDIFYKE